MQALVLAGGKGTRLRPLTDTRPKPLVPFMGAPFADGLLRRLRDAGVDRATFVVGADASPFAPLADVGDDAGVVVTVVTEEQPLDTAGGARRVLEGRTDDEPVLVCNGDILTDLDYAELVAAHRGAGATATLALTEVTDTSSFGVVVTDARGRVEAFIEKPAPGSTDARTVNAGTYVLAANAFADFPGDGPLSFERAVFPGLLAAGHRLLGVASSAYWADLGTPERYLAGHRAVLEGRCVWPVAADLEPAGPRALVHASARVADATIGQGVLVDRDCIVGDGASVTDAVLLPGARVGAGARVAESVLGAGAVVGPGVTLPSGTVLADGASA